MIKAIVFDMDGVLTDNDRYETENEKYILKKHAQLSGLGMAATKAKWNEFLEKHKGTKHWHNWKLACAHLGMEKLWIEAHLVNLKHLKLLPGVKETLPKLKKKYTLAIGSDSIQEIIDIKLGYFGILHYFDHLVSQDTTGEIKGNPKYFKVMLDHLGLNKDEIVFVDDRRRGLKTASDFGITTIAVPFQYKLHSHMRKFKSADPSHEADFVAKSLYDIPKILAKLDKKQPQ